MDEIETTDQASAAGAGSAQVAQGGQSDDQSAKLRAEAAKWRTQLRATQAELETLKGQQTDTQQLAARLATMEAELTAAKAQAALEARRATLARLAATAGVDAAVLPLLDINAIDLSNEEAALEALGKLAGPRVGPAGAATNAQKQKPNGKLSDDELKAFLFGNNGSSNIFG